MPFTDSYHPSAAIRRLPEAFYDPVNPARFPRATLRYRNQTAAASIGLERLTTEEWQTHFWDFTPLPGSLPEPLALRYHGHQFRHYNPQLGDGRGFLFAQVYEKNRHRLLDLGTKGSGQTPWSRGGDGRLTLKGAVREALATERLEALGVQTSRTLSIFETGESLVRHDEDSPTRSAVLVRLNWGHIRIGSFQRAHFHQQPELIEKLVDYALAHFGPSNIGPQPAKKAATLLSTAIDRVAQTCAQWMLAGFVHGVLNTDNINITGESFDYGPYRFLPHYEPSFTAAYFDRTGLYAYGRQPQAVRWALTRLADCLTLIGLTQEQAKHALQSFNQRFEAYLYTELYRRLNLEWIDESHAQKLFQSVFQCLEKTQMPFDRFFFDMFAGDARQYRWRESPYAHIYSSTDFSDLAQLILKHTPRANFKEQALYFQREHPVSLLIQDIEQIWDAIAQHDDWQPFYQTLEHHRQMGVCYR
jgi:uncharacterized protein YdiU (UPF0061 family)